MKFEKTGIEGLVLVMQAPVCDERGEFARVFCAREFTQQGLIAEFVQENRSLCHAPGTLRGLHLQLPPDAEAKLVRCTRGRIFDVAVDCRSGSPTFLHWFGIELTDQNRTLLYVPPGFAHGYQALVAEAEVSYLTSSHYAPQQERQIKYDDPRIGIDWPHMDCILSPKDASAAYLSTDYEGVNL